MSTEATRNSGGYTMVISGVPASVDEYDEMARSKGACLERAIDADFQHNWNGKWRKKFCVELEKLVGDDPELQRNKEVEGNKTKYLETENTYIGRVEAKTGQKYTELAQQVAGTIQFQPQGTGGGSIGDTWFTEADTVIAAVGGGSWEGFVANITNNNPGFVFDFEEDDSTPTRESIALALKTEDARAKAAAKAARLALVNG